MADGLITDGANFRTDAGGSRPSTLAERADLPMFDARAFLARPLLAAVEVTDYWARYQARHRSQNQCWSGTCVNGSMNGVHQAAALNQGSFLPDLSWPYGHLKSTGDRSFRIGTSSEWVARQRMTQGVCADSFYSEAYACANFGAAPISDSQFPSPAADADALTHKIIRYSVFAYANPDLDLLDRLLAAGVFVTIGMGNHAAMIGKNGGGVYIGKDTECAGQDLGYGEGNRGWMPDAVKNFGYGFIVAELVQTDGVAPPIPPDAEATALANLQIVRNYVQEQA